MSEVFEKKAPLDIARDFEQKTQELFTSDFWLDYGGAPPSTVEVYMHPEHLHGVRVGLGNESEYLEEFSEYPLARDLGFVEEYDAAFELPWGKVLVHCWPPPATPIGLWEVRLVLTPSAVAEPKRVYEEDVPLRLIRPRHVHNVGPDWYAPFRIQCGYRRRFAGDRYARTREVWIQEYQQQAAFARLYNDNWQLVTDRVGVEQGTELYGRVLRGLAARELDC